MFYDKINFEHKRAIIDIYKGELQREAESKL
jgi:hypothetical protein